jgi:hypothetical protein
VSTPKSCGNKIRYNNRKKAREARRRTPSPNSLNIYCCPACGWYHIGHMPEDVRRGTVSKDVWLAKTGSRR